jgi:hypothetical protein
MPQRIIDCLSTLAPPPAPGPKTTQQVLRALAEAKLSEVRVAGCGRDAVAFYEDVQRRWGTK